MDYRATPNPPSPVGGVITPPQTESFSSLGPTGSGKPDITGPDGGSTTVFDPFYGTSAAAPAVAAVAALMMQENPQLESQPLEVDQLLKNTALPFGEPANSMGAGLVQAPQAVAAAAADAKFAVDNAAQSLPAVKTVMFAPGSGNIDTGGDISIFVTMTTPVTITGGSPSLQLNDGGTATFDPANSDLATGQLAFTYQVADGEATPSLAVAAVDLNGATVQDNTADAADFSALLNAPSGVTVNSPLEVASVTASTEGPALLAGAAITLTVAMNESVSVNAAGGSPELLLNDGATATYDPGASNPSAGLLTFDYEVGAKDTIANLKTVSVYLPQATTVRDGRGNNADFSGAMQVATGLQVGTSPLQAPSAPVLAQTPPVGYSLNLPSGGLQITNMAQPQLLVQGESGPDVQVFDGGTLVASSSNYDDPFPPFGSWQLQSAPLALGLHQLTAVASADPNVIPSAPSAVTDLLVVPTSQTYFDAPTAANIILTDGSYDLTFGDAPVYFQAGDGNDVVVGGNGDGAIVLGDGNHGIFLGDGDNTVFTGNGSDVVLLGNGANYGALGDGNKMLMTGSGSNTMTLGNGNDTVLLGGGQDAITLGNGNNFVLAGSGAAVVKFGSGNDIGMAGSGEERFELSSGDYQLFLGPNLGIAHFDSAAGYAAIFGFNPQVDRLWFATNGFDLGIDSATATISPKQLDSALLSANSAGTFDGVDNRFAYDSATGQLFYDAQGSAPGSHVQLIATLYGAPQLTAANLFYLKNVF
jgi:Ca2+-binding RTX toxin-like protein